MVVAKSDCDPFLRDFAIAIGKFRNFAELYIEILAKKFDTLTDDNDAHKTILTNVVKDLKATVSMLYALQKKYEDVLHSL